MQPMQKITQQHPPKTPRDFPSDCVFEFAESLHLAYLSREVRRATYGCSMHLSSKGSPFSATSSSSRSTMTNPSC